METNRRIVQPTVEKILLVKNRLGLHMRAASRLAQLANQFKSDVFMEKDGVEINAKSIIGILMLAPPQGTKVKIRATGSDASQAVEAIEELFNDRFGEKS